jgi:hypothetical protein
MEDSYYYDDYVSEDEIEDYSTKPVPIWLSICLVIGYIVGGAFLFQVLHDIRHRFPGWIVCSLRIRVIVFIVKIVGVQSRNKCSLWNVERKE